MFGYGKRQRQTTQIDNTQGDIWRKESLLYLPATWGHAIDVPLLVDVSLFDSIPALNMELPGAKISTQEP